MVIRMPSKPRRAQNAIKEYIPSSEEGGQHTLVTFCRHIGLLTRVLYIRVLPAELARRLRNDVTRQLREMKEMCAAGWPLGQADGEHALPRSVANQEAAITQRSVVGRRSSERSRTTVPRRRGQSADT